MTIAIQAKLLFPDPFKPAGLEFDLPEAAYVSLTITDMNGSIIASPHERMWLNAGHHQLHFQAELGGKQGLIASLEVELKGETVRIVKHL